MAKKGQKFNKYDEEFIAEVIDLSFKTSVGLAAKHYDLPEGTVHT